MGGSINVTIGEVVLGGKVCGIGVDFELGERFGFHSGGSGM